MKNEPYYLESRNGWYLKITKPDGKRSQMRLGETKRESFQSWRKMLQRESDEIENPSGDDPVFGLLVAGWVAMQEKRLERNEISQAWMTRTCGMLSRFLSDHQEHRCSEIEPWLVEAYIGLRNWSPNTERMLITAIRQVFRWGVKTKRIKESAIEGISMPSATRSESCIEDDQHSAMMKATRDHPISLPFRAFLILLRHSGCRPIELRTLKRDQISADCSFATYVDHKTKRSTGKSKTVYFSPCGQTVIRILAARRKAELLLNGLGLPWTKSAVGIRMKRLREKTGIEGVVAYSYRHAFATRALVAGVDIATVAELLGHSSTEMISKHYGHLSKEHEHLKNAAARAIRFGGSS